VRVRYGFLPLLAQCWMEQQEVAVEGKCGAGSLYAFSSLSVLQAFSELCQTAFEACRC